MLSRFFFLIILLSLTSCSQFRTQNLQDKKIEELISFLKGEGEGRGRLGINQHQYLFSYEALLKENNDWLLAANIPLHGEEVLVLSDLKNEKATQTQEQLELRIERGISDYLKSKNQSPQLAGQFMQELRSIMRLVLHKKLGEQVACLENECRMGDSIYQVASSPKQLTLKKMLNDEYEIEFAALNLTDSIFRRSNIFLHSKNKSKNTSPLLSLELFWN